MKTAEEQLNQLLAVYADDLSSQSIFERGYTTGLNASNNYRDEEVRKLVEVLGEIANFDTDDATYARDKAKEAIKPYIK